MIPDRLFCRAEKILGRKLGDSWLDHLRNIRFRAWVNGKGKHNQARDMLKVIYCFMKGE